jgi:taurine dioxygenase
MARIARGRRRSDRVATEGVRTMISTLDIAKQAGSLGAVVTGLDLRDPVTDDVLAALHEALLEHLVICIRGQAGLTPDQHVAFARRWGPIEPHPYVEPVEGHPEMIRIYDPNPLTETWHADFSYAAQPPALSLLLGRTIPPYGGDTAFANAYLAFEGLSDGLKDTLRTLRALHQGTQLAKGLTLDEITSVHPVVGVHPETGREVLHVNGVYVKHLDGWTPEESAGLLELLYAQVARMEHTYRHRWQPGDLLLWDNRCVQHRVVGDTDGQPRDLHRVTVGRIEIPRER